MAGLALIPDKLIYREEDDGSGYLGYFSAETIEAIMDKFMKESTMGSLSQVNLQHSDNAVNAHLVESFIIRTPEMLAAVKAQGIENATVGSWYVAYKFDNVEDYEKAISGEFTGFSIETGSGEGEGFTANFPLYEGKGDKEFLEAVDKAISLARRFQPDVIAVSAGFDAYSDDRLLGLNFTSRGYYECAFRLRRAFSDIFAVLEGGYHHDIRKCVDSFIEGIHKGAIPPKQRWDDNMAIG